VGSASRLTSLLAYDPSLKTFTTVGNADAPYDTLTLLNDGKVLLAGRGNFVAFGPNGRVRTTAELYDPSSASFTSTGPMLESVSSAAAVRLTDGRVLLAGGTISNQAAAPTATVEIYDPNTGTFTLTGSMAIPRFNHTATLLQNGEVLVAGGISSSVTGTPLASAELFNPGTSSFVSVGPMTTAHANHTATLLSDGRVLIAGGSNRPSSAPNSVTSAAEIFDPSTETFSATGAMASPREFHRAALLNNGQVLVAGGDDALNILASAEIYDPTSSSFSLTANMSVSRENFVAAALSNGDVLVAGGLTAFTEGGTTDTAERFVL
jgi:hypothetical protein